MERKVVPVTFSLLLILIAVLGFFIWRTYSKDEVSAPMPERNSNVLRPYSFGESKSVSDLKKEPYGDDRLLDKSRWRIYEDKENGFRFRYPDFFTIRSGSEIGGTDSGKKSEVALRPDEKYENELFSGFYLTVSMTSPDFGYGILEGCCAEYSGPAIDFSLSDDAIIKKIQKAHKERYRSQYSEPLFDLRRVKVGSRRGISYHTIFSYASKSVHERTLVEYGNKTYSSMVIMGPDLRQVDVSDMSEEESEKVDQELDRFITSGEYKKDEKANSYADLYSQILSTFEFF
jgi:hypothetical protein